MGPKFKPGDIVQHMTLGDLLVIEAVIAGSNSYITTFINKQERIFRPISTVDAVCKMASKQAILLYKSKL